VNEALTETTRERLVRAATEVIESGGYAAASVAAVAERAGVAAGEGPVERAQVTP
jgi:AcrR family transcriptional regulator